MEQHAQPRSYGLAVDLPKPPLPGQPAIMSRIIKNLVKREKITIIESPTGSGKTLSILMPVLAFSRDARASGTALTDESVVSELVKKEKSFEFCFCTSEESTYCKQRGQSSALDPQTPPYICRTCQKDASLLIGREREYFGNDLPVQIYFVTRTHQQIDQAIEQLKTTTYCNDLNMTILSSRKVTCINEVALKSPVGVDDKCRQLTADTYNRKRKKQDIANMADTCQFYTSQQKIRDSFKSIGEQLGGVYSIEDLVRYGRSCNMCPYFGAKSLLPDADLIFCTYSYILDELVRQATDISVRNRILIFDEGHNVDDVCRDLATFQVTTKELVQLDRNLRSIRGHYDDDEEIIGSMDILLELFTKLLDFIKSDLPGPGGVVLQPHRLKATLLRLGVDGDFVRRVKVADGIVSGVGFQSSTRQQNDSCVGSTKLQTSDSRFISKLVNTLDLITCNGYKDINCFRVVVDEQSNRPHSSHDCANRLLVVCVDARVVFEQVQLASWATIIASGTLTPLKYLQSELGVDIGNPLVIKRSIEANRFMATMLLCGPGGISLDCSFGKKDDQSIMDAIGSAIFDVCNQTPGGVLCFFTSYDRLSLCYRHWTDTGLLGRIFNSSRKTINREVEKQSDEHFEMLRTSHIADSNSHGSLLFAVVKGRFSEGVDMPGSGARAVITIGIPFLNHTDIRVSIKKQYNDEMAIAGSESGRKFVDGSEWMKVQASVPLCQAIGRCIRNTSDWGFVVMIDSRFGQSDWSQYFPVWVSERTSVVRDYAQFQKKVAEFIGMSR